MIENILIGLEPYIRLITTILLHSLWQGLLVGVITAAVLSVLRNSRANTRYTVSCLAMAIMIVAVATTTTLVLSSGMYSATATPPSAGGITGDVGNLDAGAIKGLVSPTAGESSLSRWWESYVKP